MKKIIFACFLALLNITLQPTIVGKKNDEQIELNDSKQKEEHKVQKKGNFLFSREWEELSSWMALHNFVTIVLIGQGYTTDSWTKIPLLSSMDKKHTFPVLLTYMIIPALTVALIATLTAWFTFPEQEGKINAKDPTVEPTKEPLISFTDYLLPYLVPALMAFALPSFLFFAIMEKYQVTPPAWSWVSSCGFDITYESACCVCLLTSFFIWAPIYHMLQDRNIIPQSANFALEGNQKADEPSFLSTWKAMCDKMLIYTTITAFMICQGDQTNDWKRAWGLRLLSNEQSFRDQLVFIFVPCITMIGTATCAAWFIFSAQEETSNNQEDSMTFFKHLFTHLTPALYALAITSVFAFAFENRNSHNIYPWQWVVRLERLSGVIGSELFSLIYPYIVTCLTVAPILTAYELAENDISS